MGNNTRYFVHIVSSAGSHTLTFILHDSLVRQTMVLIVHYEHHIPHKITYVGSVVEMVLLLALYLSINYS